LQDALEVTPDTEVTVDLVAREVRASAPGGPVELKAPFDIDDYTRWRLIEGLDDISLTLRYADEITSFEEHRPHWLPTVDAVA
jgi:3-isopropylmalate/(R)-2-methylmalate dehydratase small subunit